MANVTSSAHHQKRIIVQVAHDIAASASQVNAAVSMLDAGDTVPFIARYRKEATGGLSDTQLRTLEERLAYLRELENRRTSILASIEEQGKLSDELNAQINAALTKSELEDLYLPFKRKRKTKGQAAIEAGLLLLADSLWENPAQRPEQLARTFIDADKGIADIKAALEGARYILMERFAEDATLIARLRTLLSERGYVCSTVMRGKETEGAKFQDYFDFQERFDKVPSHRAMAMFRGRSESILSLSLKLKEADSFSVDGCIAAIAAHTGFKNSGLSADAWREQVVAWTWKVKLSLHLETDLFSALRDRADVEAIRVFAGNLKDLLLAAPAGQRTTMGLDPGYRSGVKVTVVDHTGKVVAHNTIYPHQPQKQWQDALAILAGLCKKHKVELIAIGNGTASRETDQLAGELIKLAGISGLTKVVVSEAGASVYSASTLAEQEFPDLDVTIRGAISIARRLQDPLSELVKIDPKAIGVGQYQHDVSQPALARSLEATVEDCVNSVGVDLNTASAALLNRVAGLSNTLASNIVQFRDENGAFTDRKQLKKVPRLGAKAFEQGAGFLRIVNGSNPLDASSVHPETYPLVKRIVEHSGRPLDSLIGDIPYLKSLDAKHFTDDTFGLPTVKDILLELEKPGRDPRPDFRAVRFEDGIDKISDLSLNQVLEGQVSNVTNFGAFVDVGVHQDGLVHISAMSDQFIKDPHEVVKAGDIIKVKVMAVDVARKRIGLSMRMSDDANDQEQDRKVAPGNTKSRNTARKPAERQPQSNEQPSALALQLKAALANKE